MAGVKGKSGGPRPNSGGKRPGAGRKPSPPPLMPAKPPAQPGADPAQTTGEQSPLDFLKSVYGDETVDLRIRVRAAVAAAQYEHTKRHDGGKKEDQADAAKKAAGGKFGPKAPPKLIVNNG